MRELVDCPICEGVGVIEGNKGREEICFTCNGKGRVYDQESPGNQTPSPKEKSATEENTKR